MKNQILMTNLNYSLNWLIVLVLIQFFSLIFFLGFLKACSVTLVTLLFYSLLYLFCKFFVFEDLTDKNIDIIQEYQIKNVVFWLLWLYSNILTSMICFFIMFYFLTFSGATTNLIYKIFNDEMLTLDLLMFDIWSYSFLLSSFNFFLYFCLYIVNYIIKSNSISITIVYILFNFITGAFLFYLALHMNLTNELITPLPIDILRDTYQEYILGFKYKEQDQQGLMTLYCLIYSLDELPIDSNNFVDLSKIKTILNYESSQIKILQYKLIWPKP